MDKNRNRSGISQSCFIALADLTNEDMHPQAYDKDAISQREPTIFIPENTQTLGPKSRTMKKKPTNLHIRKFPTRKATNPIYPSQPTTENLDPNIQIFSKYSNPSSQSPTVHGMHANRDTFPTPVVSFPKVALAPQAIAQHPSQPVGDPSLADEPPNKDTFCDFNSWETSAEFEEPLVTSRNRSPLVANDCSVGAENGMEVEFHGPRFTWSRGSLFKRLDRVICNSERASIFSDSTIFHLPKLSPDHRLILVRSNGLSSRNLHSRPFRFQVAWLTNEGFQDFVAESWDQNLHHLDTADQFRSKVTVWNKQSFGNIFWRKNRLLARLGGIQRALESYFSKGLSRLEEKLKADLEESCDSLDFRHYPHPNCFPIIEEDLLQSLNKGVEDAEVQKTIFRMYPLKAPGPDGFHAIFYQTQWNTVGSSLCRLVKEVFQNKHLPGGLNSTLLALIPKKTGATGFLAIKVDLEKAYDRLSWEFIIDTLREARIPSDLIQVIMACITSATMRVLWNGEATKEFSPSRGIRQGYPLSPYLLSFVLNASVMEFITPLLLEKATVEQARVISAVLADFCTCSDAKINANKTLLFFSKNMGDKDISEILGFLGFSITFDLGKYLGVPLHHSRVSSSMFQNIVDKVEKKLSGWNASHLSLASRITLASSVLQAIPIFVMQTLSLPSGVRERIDRACRRFIWSGSSPQQKLSMVSWRNVCNPKAFGGLGFKSLAMINRALHMKLAWGIISSPNSLWVQVLSAKYRVDRHNLPQVLPNHYGSHLWKSLGHVWSEATSNAPLIAYATNTIPLDILDCKVADLVDINGSWYWSRFEQYLPSNIILKIAALHPPSHAKGTDTIFWAHSKHGQFTTSSAYLALSVHNPAAADRAWRLIWHWKGPQSMRVFLWQTFHAGLKTIAELIRRHLSISSRCDRCGAVCEDVIHGLRDCPLVKQFWLNIIPTSKRHNFFNSRLHYWLRLNLGDAKHKGSQVDFLASPRMAGWPWCTLNTDGAHKIHGTSAAGGLIRDHLGRWLTGFGMMIGSCSVTVAELWGLYQGLQPAWNFGIRRLKVETDSLCVTQLVARPSVTSNEYAPLIQAIKDYLNLDWQVSLSHIYREANFAVDYMANLAFSLPLGLIVYPTPPLGVRSFLSHDSYGVLYPRSVVL
ncbi:putative ribonuclease H protein [Citrus sinensis]|nr:putative ribonuclease H protein [Citrus sinensis]